MDNKTETNTTNTTNTTPPTKVFEDWEVDCNDCSHYWDSSCDSVGSHTKPCKSFLAHRGVNIPAELKIVEEDIRSLRFNVIFFEGLFVLHLLSHIFLK